MANILTTLFSWLPLAVLAISSIKVVRALQFYLLYSSDLSQYRSTSGGGAAWALVTGASDGIGRGFAHELLRRGFNVIIHGRNEKKLLGIKDALLKEFPNREVKLLVLDAMAKEWTDDYDSTVLAAVKGLNLTMLINNVGGMGGLEPPFDPVSKRPAWQINSMVMLNATFMTQITRVLTPILTRDKSQRTIIVNVSSAAELISSPYLVVYSATKAYVSRWSASLESELRTEGHKIDVHSLIVGAVATDNAASVPNLFNPAVPTFVRAVVKKFGASDVVITPYWPHGVQVWVMTNLMPNLMVEKFIVNMGKELTANYEKKKKGT